MNRSVPGMLWIAASLLLAGGSIVVIAGIPAEAQVNSPGRNAVTSEPQRRAEVGSRRHRQGNRETSDQQMFPVIRYGKSPVKPDRPANSSNQSGDDPVASAIATLSKPFEAAFSRPPSHHRQDSVSTLQSRVHDTAAVSGSSERESLPVPQYLAAHCTAAARPISHWPTTVAFDSTQRTTILSAPVTIRIQEPSAVQHRIDVLATTSVLPESIRHRVANDVAVATESTQPEPEAARDSSSAGNASTLVDMALAENSRSLPNRFADLELIEFPDRDVKAEPPSPTPLHLITSPAVALQSEASSPEPELPQQPGGPVSHATHQELRDEILQLRTEIAGLRREPARIEVPVPGPSAMPIIPDLQSHRSHHTGEPHIVRQVADLTSTRVSSVAEQAAPESIEHVMAAEVATRVTPAVHQTGRVLRSDPGELAAIVGRDRLHPTAAQLLAQGRHELAKGKLEEAETTFRSAVEKSTVPSERALATYLLATSLRQLQRQDEAVRYFREVEQQSDEPTLASLARSQLGRLNSASRN